MRPTPLLVIALVVVSFSNGSAQVVSAGERVRVTSGRSWIGIAQRISADSLSLLPEGADVPLSFELASLDRLEVYEGRKSRSRGFAIGAGIGGVIGLAVALQARSSDCNVNSDEDVLGIGGGICDSIGTLAMIAFPPFGLLIGGGMGALLGGGDRWTDVVAGSRPTVAVEGWRRISLGLTLDTRF